MATKGLEPVKVRGVLVVKGTKTSHDQAANAIVEAKFEIRFDVNDANQGATEGLIDLQRNGEVEVTVKAIQGRVSSKPSADAKE